jgi:hypothetical protein
VPSVKNRASNGNRAKADKTAKPKPSRVRKPAPELPEGLRKLTLRTFQKTYEAHHSKNS